MFEIGNSLREARLRQQLDFPEIEHATKIRSKYLRALEDEQFDVLPAQTYVKGFLRTYAEYLGLDGQLYVDEFNSRYVTGEDEPPLRARRSSTYHRANRRVESSAIIAALAAIGVLTLIVIAAWKYGGGDSQEEAIPNLALTRPAQEQPAAGAQRKRPLQAKLVLMAARGDCWLEIHAGSATGKLLYQGTLERGQSQRFVARRLWIAALAPRNLALVLNGKPVAVPGKRSPLVMIVTAQGVARAPVAT